MIDQSFDLISRGNVDTKMSSMAVHVHEHSTWLARLMFKMFPWAFLYFSLEPHLIRQTCLEHCLVCVSVETESCLHASERVPRLKHDCVQHLQPLPTGKWVNRLLPVECVPLVSFPSLSFECIYSACSSSLSVLRLHTSARHVILLPSAMNTYHTHACRIYATTRVERKFIHWINI